MCIEANEVTQPASAAVALQTLPTTPDHSEGANNATLGNRTESPNPIGETVLPARTITKIASKPSKSRKHVTFTASVISDVGTTPTGTVMFKHGAKILWAEEPLSHGIASITLKMVEVRGAVSATYSGDQHHTSSSSDTLLQILKSNAIEALTSSPAMSAYGPSLAPVAVNHQPLAITASPTRGCRSPLINTRSARSLVPQTARSRPREPSHY